ncbi:hypothetical protein ACQR10_06260 [Bradyrhizobium sp. HKCCYLRH2060]|uniref:hypothetical protein n=1 Tax=Bradyrhizobium TaxID=374 RepID=UPI0029165E45|nr:hypothetical protein [Bradyrhizobium sp. SZCCHNR3003]
MVTITISYGYDVHSIEVDEVTYAAIKSGKKVTLAGQGFVHEEDGPVVDHWIFNETPGDIYFRLDNGAEFRSVSSWVE